MATFRLGFAPSSSSYAVGDDDDDDVGIPLSQDDTSSLLGS